MPGSGFFLNPVSVPPLVRVKLLQCLSKLIRTGGRPGAAVDSIKSLNGFLHIHSLNQPSKALGIAGAAACKGYVIKLIIPYLKDISRAQTPCVLYFM